MGIPVLAARPQAEPNPELCLAGQGRDTLLQIQWAHPLGIGYNFAVNPGQLLREFPGKRQALSAQPPSIDERAA